MVGTASRINAAVAAAAGQPVLVQTFAEWREAARELLAFEIAPHAINWMAHEDGGDLFSGAPPEPASAAAIDLAHVHPTLHLPRKLMDMLQSAACCRVDGRWAFLYRVIWRWQQGEREVLSAADEDGSRLHAMVKAVHREEHDMHAYIRFRERPEAEGAPRFVAWFEPAHDVLPQVAQHFVSRMGRISWMIATPDASVLWDGETLHNTGPLMRSAADLDDAGEALWLIYYRSIFNPARLNAKPMQSHIPSRFWKNLPEGTVVPELASNAAAGARRTGQTEAVGRRRGTTIPIAANKAEPQREAPSTLDQCRRCELWQHATQAVGGVGPKRARLMLVGEQPGDQEDIAGKPFVGPAGRLLDDALIEAGIDRSQTYVTNVVKHFKWEPRGKRRIHKKPNAREITACRPWLEAEISLVKPKVIVCLGATATQALLGSKFKVTRQRGQFIESTLAPYIMATVHPSSILRAPDDETRHEEKRKFIEDLKRVAHVLGGRGSAVR